MRTMSNSETLKIAKRCLLIFTLLMWAVCSQGQTTADRAAVLQKIIDDPALQQYYPQDKGDKLPQPVIMQYPENFSADVCGILKNRAVFMAMPEVTAQKVPDYFSFRSIDINKNSAVINAVYFYNYNYTTLQFKMLKIDASIQKSGEEWNITNLNLGGDKK
jgi:hypothetical protein